MSENRSPEPEIRYAMMQHVLHPQHGMQETETRNPKRVTFCKSNAKCKHSKPEAACSTIPIRNVREPESRNPCNTFCNLITECKNPVSETQSSTFCTPNTKKDMNPKPETRSCSTFCNPSTNCKNPKPNTRNPSYVLCLAIAVQGACIVLRSFSGVLGFGVWGLGGLRFRDSGGWAFSYERGTPVLCGVRE
jgi:hypothetical protein